MPHQICHAHCPKGGGGLGALAVLVAVIAIAAVARPVAHAAVDVLEVAAIVVGSVLGLAVAGGIAYVALRVHRSHARARLTMSRHAPIAQRRSEALSGARPAIKNRGHVIDGVVVSDEITERR